MTRQASLPRCLPLVLKASIPNRYRPPFGFGSARQGRDKYSMNPQELYQAGHLNEAIKALSAELRDSPTDSKRRTFLFELLCFAGEYERADKQL